MNESSIYIDLFNQSSNGLAVVNLTTLLVEKVNPTFIDFIDADENLVGKPVKYLIGLFSGEKNLEKNYEDILTCVFDGGEFIGDVVFQAKGKSEKKYFRLVIKGINRTSFIIEIKDLSEYERNKLRMNKAINEAKLTSKLVTIASQNLDEQEILDTACKELAHAINLRDLDLLVMENKGEYFEVIAEHIDTGRLSVVNQKLKFPASTIIQALNGDQPIVLDDITLSPDSYNDIKKILIERGTYSFLAMPLIVKGKIIGLIILDIPKKHEFSQEEIYMAKHVAGTTGHILEVGRLYSELNNELNQRKIAETALRNSEDAMLAIYNITSSRILSYSEKIQAMLSLGCQLFDMDIGVLTRYLEGKHYAKEVYSEKYDSIKDQIFSKNQIYCDDVFNHKEPVDENLIQPRLGLPPDEINHYTVASYLGLPLKVHGKNDGTLIFFNSTPHFYPINSTNRELIRLMAQWMGTETEREEFVYHLKTNTDEIENKNIELADSRDQALEIARLKSEFLATVSHEIRTPMNAIIGMTDLLLRTELNREQREYAKIVNDSGQLLLKLINDILDFSKIEAGKIILEKIDFDLESALEAAVDLFTTKSHEKGLDIIVYLDKNVPKRVNGDLLRVQQVIMNLVGNAIKFTESGGVTIKAEVQEETKCSTKIRFYVKDTGIGISQEVYDRLFQPFTQADGSTTRKYGGTGLGLAISKRLIELMGGEIGLESEENKGTTFWFVVEFDKPEDVVYISDHEMQFENVHALVIEKKIFYREYLCQYLKDWGIEAYGVRTFDEMAKLIKADAKFELLVIDMSEMTKMDMYKLNQITKEISHFSDIKKIFINSLEQKVTKEFGDFNLTYRIIKPVKRSALYKMVENVLIGNAPEPEQDIDPESQIGFQSLLNPFVEKNVSSPNVESMGEVLLAEDNTTNQKLAALQLAKLGYQCNFVSNGDDALDAVINDPERFKFILMDSQMPGMDGITATMKIRDFEFTRGQHIPIIAMTGNSTDDDRARCIKAGMDDYISKPVTMQVLADAIQRVFPKEFRPRATAITGPSATGELSLGEHQVTLDECVVTNIRQLQIDGQPDILTELIDLYRTDAKTMIGNIHKAWEVKDSLVLKRWAHSLKGSSANIGARKLSFYLSALEIQAANGKFIEAEDSILKIEDEYIKVIQALEKEKKVGVSN